MARRIGRYEVIAELGRGGFGQVFRCLDPNLGTPVAIKILTADGDAGMMVRFRNEAATSRRLKHPNIVAIYDFGEQDAVPYIVMELLEGEDLHRVIEARRPLSLLHKIGILSQMAAGLGHAHNEGIIHRDVKPANVMLLHDGTVKMMDFGIALITQSTHSRLTPRGAVIGTFRYMAPEQFRGGEPDVRSDIFSYGLIAYELLSGVHPFFATEAAAQMYNILNVQPVPIRQFCPDCPVELQTLLARLLLKDPDLRYQSLDDVLADLEPALLKLRESRSMELINEAHSAKRQNQLEKAQGLVREALTLTPALEAAREFREQLQSELRRQAVRPRVEELVKRAREAMAAGNPSDAAQGFESAIGLDPLDTTLQGLLREAREAADRLRDALPLVADADRALANGDAAGAARIARRAVDLVPGLARAKDILVQAETALADERRKLRFAEDAARLRRLIEVHSWKEGSELVAALNRDFPDYSEVRILEEKLTAAQKREEDERTLAAGLTTARAQFRDGDLSGALDGLKLLSVQFPQSADVGSLLNAVQLEVDEKRRRDLVTRAVEEARRLAASEQFESAVKALDGALVRYPEDQDLQRERRAVVAASREAAWRAAIQKAITRAEELRSQARHAEAVQLLDSFLPADGGDPAIVALRDSIMAEHADARRAEELRDVIRRANELIAKNELDSATRMLQASPTHVRENPEVTRLLGAAESQKRLRAEKQTAFEALALEVPPLCEQGRFDEALRGVDSFETQHGGDPGVSRLRNRILSDQHKAQRSAEELLAQATALIAANPLEATVLLGGAPNQLRARPEIQKLEQAARDAAAEQRNREALAERIALAKTLYAERRFAEALSLLETGLQNSPGSADLLKLRADVLAEQDREQRSLAEKQTAFKAL
ncbi:MAG TPA: protein kinase, partial [Acidobacteriaceae bacterium]|nr:protein kinase [Acidobacteriaceae bacterium]